jgi:hypothetical protein
MGLDWRIDKLDAKYDVHYSIFMSLCYAKEVQSAGT